MVENVPRPVLSRTVRHLYGLCLMFVSLAFVTGCARVELSLNAGGYNRALERAGNKQVFLNAIRASRGYPLHFTSIGSFSGRSVFKQGKLMSSIPFVRDTVSPHTITPSVSIQGNMTDVQITSLNAEGFAEGLINPTNLSDFSIFWNSPEWDDEFTTMMFVSRYVIHKDDNRIIEINHKNRCRRPDGEYETDLCHQIKQNIANCSSSKLGQNAPRTKDGTYYIFENDPYHACKFKLFQAYRWKIQLAQLKLIPNRDGENEAITSFTGIFSIVQRSNGRATSISRNIDVNKVSGGNDKAKSFFGLRSPGDMIQYVGKLISAQLRSRNPYTPTIRLESGESVPLFKINHAGEGDGSVAIGVSFEGDRFQVPDTGFDRRKQHQSLQALTLINHLLSLRTNRDLLRGNTILLSN